MKRSHAVGASRSFVGRQPSVRQLLHLRSRRSGCCQHAVMWDHEINPFCKDLLASNRMLCQLREVIRFLRPASQLLRFDGV